jgi:hypothetical protein
MIFFPGFVQESLETRTASGNKKISPACKNFS